MKNDQPMNFSSVIKSVVENKVNNVDKINAIKAGETLELTVTGGEFNDLYDQFKPQRKAKLLSMSFCDNNKVMTVVSLVKNDPEV